LKVAKLKQNIRGNLNVIHTNEKIIKNKVGLLNLAEDLQNISKACKIMGLSRETFYRYKEAVEKGGINALIDKSRRKPNISNRVDDVTEKAVKEHAIEFPAHGQLRTSNELRKKGIFVSPSGVRSIWVRYDLERFKKRLSALEKKSAEEGLVLTESQLSALERKKDDDAVCGEIETAHPGYLGSQDTFYVGTLKGVGRVYQQTFVDTYSKVAICKLYTTKTPITAADLLNERVLPVFEDNKMSLLRMLTDRGTEFCGKVEQHDYELYLAVNDIEHTKTKAYHPQTNGICERFHKTILQEFYQVAFRKKIYSTLDELQNDLDDWIYYYNYERTHQGKMCCGRTPMETFIDGKKIWKEKVDSLNLSDNITDSSSKELAGEMSRLRVSAPEGLGLDISEASHANEGLR
jgi:transposase InsO family protein